PSEISGLLEGIIGDVLQNSGGGTLSLGLILTLWSASNGMTALMNAFNVAYDVEDNRSFIHTKSLSVFFTLILSVSIILTFVLIVFGGQIGDLMFGVIGLDDEFQYVWNLVRSLLPLLLIFVVFFIMYMTAPNIKLKIKSVIPGTLFTTIAFLLASWGFSFYVSNFSNYSATYGSIAGVIILIFRSQYVWNLVRSLLPLLLIFVVFFIMYMTAPNIKLKIKSVIPGTLFTTIAFLLASWGFSFYVSNFSNYSATYGSIAGVIILIF